MPEPLLHLAHRLKSHLLCPLHCILSDHSQELELQKRYMSAIDALSGGLTARTLDQGPPSPPSAAAGAGVGGAEGPRSTLDVFDARLRRTLEAHMQRAENVQVRPGAWCW